MLTEPLRIGIKGPVCVLQYDASMLNSAATMLEHFERVTTVNCLRMQLAEATMAYLKPAFAVYNTHAKVRRETITVRTHVSDILLHRYV